MSRPDLQASGTGRNLGYGNGKDEKPSSLKSKDSAKGFSWTKAPGKKTVKRRGGPPGRQRRQLGQMVHCSKWSSKEIKE